ncbi:MAG: radical SAM protein [Candidatus Omnitrophica bacterium]|nr:radical SAM protein [Candidatus Omnitrophota bacterium]
MNLKSNYQKLQRHLKSGGLSYAIVRGIKYFIFLVRKQGNRFKYPPKNTITKGKLDIVYSDCGINILWNGCKVTQEGGLNIAINTLGLWTDSSKADWRILKEGKNCFKIKIVFRDLPLSQTWYISMKSEHKIHWQVNMEVEEWLHIDEFRLLSLINPRYKSWVNNYQQGDFFRLENRWHNSCFNDSFTSLVGARFFTGDEPLPSFALESFDDKKKFLPLIQTPSLDINAYIIGFRYIDTEEKKGYPPGFYYLFSGEIRLFEESSILDNKIESLRQDYLKTEIEGKEKNKKLDKKIKVLLVNLPWQKGEKGGVRAGSRWPHIKDASEVNYLPFPFFLAYSTSLLRKNGVEADLIDAIAQEIPEDKFIEKLSGMDFDVLVTETSVPSFYYDIELLRKISSLGISIVLCGPHPEIYKPEFLEKYSFINFVLYGEYEVTLLELIKTIIKKRRDFSFVEGLMWKNGKDKVVKNRPRRPFDINILPWPCRDTLPMEKYWDLPGNIPHPSAQMLASRGCPFGCNFCLWPQVLFGGRNYRTRDIVDVVDEMEYLIRKKRVKSLYFDDDTFNIRKENTLKLCDMIIKRGLNKTPWAIMAKADLMDEEILENLKKAGLWAVKYGVESSSQELLDRCGKHLNLTKAERMIKFTKSLGIKVHLTFLFGLEGETKETIRRTIDYSLKLAPDSVQYSILTPFPGTEIFEKLDKEGRITTKNWSLYDGHHSCVFKPGDLSPSDLENAKQYAYRAWLDFQRKKRGFWGNVRRFFDYYHRYGLSGAVRKTNSYLNYILSHRKKFIRRI